VLAITDHDKVTYPWTDFGRDPAALGMIDVQGNELSGGHHIVSLFSSYANPTSDVSTRLTGVANAGGIAYFAHPRRYSFSAQWYADHYAAHPHCIGQAIYNQGDRHTGHRELWDAVLSLTMPSRPVWGISEDDSHQASHIGRNRTYMLMPSLSHANVRTSLESGAFYATYSTSSSHVPPALSGVTVDETAGTITLSGTGYTQVIWVSMGTQVATGETINLISAPGVDKYVRAVLVGAEGRTYTNPFGLEFLVNRPPAVSAGPDQTVQVGAVAILNGSVIDDGLPEDPGEPTVLWQKVSGEGTVTFGDPAAAQTTATFSAPGTYVLSLTGDDGEFSASDEVTITVVDQLPGWTAYNDVSHGTGQLTTNITRFGLNQAGELIDFATATPLGVSVQIVNNPSAPAVSGGTGGPMPNAGTDAHTTFNGKVSFSNVIYYGPQGWWVDAIFTGLDPNRRYEFATSVNRGRSDYGDRWSKFTISDIDEATEASTPGVTVFSPTSVAFSSGNNSANGHVARWTEIRPGANGSFKIRVEAGDGAGMHPRYGYAFDGIQLRDLGSAEPDLDPPTIQSLSPANGATAVPVATPLAITFDENVKKGAGNIVVRTMGGSAFATIDVASANVAVSGALVTITLPAALAHETQYFVEIDAGAIQDLADNPFAGISGSATWSFTTDVPDTTPPSVVSFSPANGATSVAVTSNLVIMFDEPVKKGTGDIVIRNAEGAPVETIAITNANVIVSGDTVTIDPSTNLPGGQTIHVEIDHGAILDLANNPFTGISGSASWSFTTEIPVAVTTFTGGPTSKPSSTSADNWNIVSNWNNGAGPVPSGTINAVIASDKFANTRDATLAYTGTFTMQANSWLRIGQTPANNNQNALGSGVVTLHSGAEIEIRYEGALTLANPIHFAGDVLITNQGNATENKQRTLNGVISGTGLFRYEMRRGNSLNINSANPNWSGGIIASFTDTNFGNASRLVANANGAFGTGDVTVNDGIGLVIAAGLGNVIDNNAALHLNGRGHHTDRNLRLNSSETVRALFIDGVGIPAGTYNSTSGLVDYLGNPLITGTGALTVLTGPVAPAAPELLTIEDDKDGGPVEVGTELSYVLTFNSAMDLETFSISDFSNAGTADITIADITEVAPEVYAVLTIPSSEGTLQFRINQGAVIKDFDGNALDTSTAILHDTIITVVSPTVPGTPFGDWAAGFPSLTNTDPALDFDNGGLATALEWVLGGDPTDPSDDATILPTIDATSNPDFFIFTFNRRDQSHADPNTTIAVEYGSDLVGWTTAGAGPDIVITETDLGAVDQVEVKIRRTLVTGGSMFARLKVEVSLP